jgi:myosin protein heavy chain
MKVQCCFIIDATGSMGVWLDAAKTQTRTIIKDITAEHPTADLHIAAVFYRDFKDGPPIVVPFTPDIDLYLDEIAPVEPMGGDDTCEDMAGGFAEMLKLDWDPAAVKNAFLVCDAPGHGAQWHDIVISDSYPNNEFGLSELVTRTATSNINFMVIKANDTLGPMITRMNELFKAEGKTITVTDLVPQTPPRSSARDSPPGIVRREYGAPEPVALSRGVSRAVSDAIYDTLSPV